MPFSNGVKNSHKKNFDGTIKIESDDENVRILRKKCILVVFIVVKNLEKNLIKRRKCKNVKIQ